MNIRQLEYREAHIERPERPDKVNRIRRLVLDYDDANSRVVKKQAAVNAVGRLNVSDECINRLKNELTFSRLHLRQMDDEFDAVILDMADEIRARNAKAEMLAVAEARTEMLAV